mmetsp:Transcript_50834/g.107885  ORF Transcript_50834/g.107885 Transcript_50834/m.107885 type:complete len:296 (-) Transcript_50834:1008-1895(-)
MRVSAAFHLIASGRPLDHSVTLWAMLCLARHKSHSRLFLRLCDSPAPVLVFFEAWQMRRWEIEPGILTCSRVRLLGPLHHGDPALHLRWTTREMGFRDVAKHSRCHHSGACALRQREQEKHELCGRILLFLVAANQPKKLPDFLHHGHRHALRSCFGQKVGSQVDPNHQSGTALNASEGSILEAITVIHGFLHIGHDPWHIFTLEDPGEFGLSMHCMEKEMSELAFPRHSSCDGRRHRHISTGGPGHMASMVGRERPKLLFQIFPSADSDVQFIAEFPESVRVCCRCLQEPLKND